LPSTRLRRVVREDADRPPTHPRKADDLRGSEVASDLEEAALIDD
jgi:hypothetical protein